MQSGTGRLTRASWSRAPQPMWTGRCYVVYWRRGSVKLEFLMMTGNCLARPQSRRFIIQFKGDINSATRRAQAARRALKDITGAWKQFSVNTIEGGESRVFVGMDTTPKQVRREIQTKAMAAAVRELFPSLRTRHDRQRGVVFLD
eukprot:8954436-Pyramimonas_sp.AAC.1